MDVVRATVGSQKGNIAHNYITVAGGGFTCTPFHVYLRFDAVSLVPGTMSCIKDNKLLSQAHFLHISDA